MALQPGDDPLIEKVTVLIGTMACRSISSVWIEENIKNLCKWQQTETIYYLVDLLSNLILSKESSCKYMEGTAGHRRLSTRLQLDENPITLSEGNISTTGINVIAHWR